MNAFKSFLWKEIVFTIFIGVVSFILFKTVFISYYQPIFWLLLGIIATVTGLLYYFTLLGKEKKSRGFASHYMMVTGVKMMVYLVFIVVYSFMYPKQASFFLISFFVLYLIYTIFEVVFIVRSFKKNRA